MRIVFDNIIFTLQHCGGISVVWGNLLHYILKDKRYSVDCLEFDGAEDNLVRNGLDMANCRISRYKNSMMIIKRLLNPILPKTVNQDEHFIFHSSYYRICKSPLAINVTTVHDFAYALFVKNPLKRFVHCHQMFTAIRKSDHVVCISENTRNDLFRFLPDVNPDKVSVIYNGVDFKFHRDESVEREDFLLFIGKRDRYKNFMSLITPLAQIGRKLKIVGAPLTQSEIDAMTDAALQYEYCGFVSDEELNRLYNSAFCLMYTSSYEGFGLPVLEAQMAGCPVIALNASSIPEVIGDKRMLIDSISKVQIEEKLDMLGVPEFRDNIILSGIDNARRFSWQKMAEEYDVLYNKLLSETK